MLTSVLAELDQQFRDGEVGHARAGNRSGDTRAQGLHAARVLSFGFGATEHAKVDRFARATREGNPHHGLPGWFVEFVAGNCVLGT